jgi:hypothetical protein
MSQGMKYAVDIVLCIDATGSMSPIIDKVKDTALRFHDDLTSVMNEKGKVIDVLRIKAISFKDYWADGPKAMSESQFFPLPEEREGFSRFVKEIVADGGGDEPESGLEAVAFAIRSGWSTAGDRRRQLVVVWTDASAHRLDKSPKPAGYPSDLPKNLDELTDLWEGQSSPLSKTGKRLIIYAPDADPWTHMANNWENAIHYASKAGDGLAEVTYKEILNAIANSV